MLSTFSIRALDKVIIVVLNSWSDKHNIPALSECCSGAFSVSSGYVFCLLVCLVIFVESQILQVCVRSKELW